MTTKIKFFCKNNGNGHGVTLAQSFTLSRSVTLARNVTFARSDFLHGFILHDCILCLCNVCTIIFKNLKTNYAKCYTKSKQDLICYNCKLKLKLCV